jgi:polyferredoxin
MARYSKQMLRWLLLVIVQGFPELPTCAPLAAAGVNTVLLHLLVLVLAALAVLFFGVTVNRSCCIHSATSTCQWNEYS